jgi:hypothetical protein
VASSKHLALAFHWNGTAWSQVPLPHPSRYELLAVKALSATDAWAVGDGETGVMVLHWNGTAWSRAATPGIPGSAALEAVTALSPTDAWAVGDVFTSTGDQSLVLHWDGTNWTRQRSPSPGGTGTSDFSKLFGVSVLSARNAWAVGSYGQFTAKFRVGKPLALHWDGTSWTQVASPFFGQDSQLDSVQALSPTDAWAVGGLLRRTTPSSTVILHWNGTAWTRS